MHARMDAGRTQRHDNSSLPFGQWSQKNSNENDIFISQMYKNKKAKIIQSLFISQSVLYKVNIWTFLILE